MDELKNFSKSVGMQDQVTFTGALSRQELKELYKTHNVLVFPSKYSEPFGISQVEAMASGLVLVTSGTGGSCEIIVDRTDGFLFESENFLDLTDILYHIASNPSERKEVALNGRSKALSKFSQTKAAAEIESMLIEFICKKGLI